MSNDQERREQLDRSFTAVFGPDTYAITFPNSMKNELSQDECRTIIEQTIKFAEKLIAAYDSPDLRRQGFKKTPWGWQAPMGTTLKACL